MRPMLSGWPKTFTTNMHAPQIILIVILALDLGLIMAKHGEEKKGEHNFFVNLFSTAVMVGLLIWGGFFD